MRYPVRGKVCSKHCFDLMVTGNIGELVAGNRTYAHLIDQDICDVEKLLRSILEQLIAPGPDKDIG